MEPELLSEETSEEQFIAQKRAAGWATTRVLLDMAFEGKSQDSSQSPHFFWRLAKLNPDSWFTTGTGRPGNPGCILIAVYLLHNIVSLASLHL